MNFKGNYTKKIVIGIDPGKGGGIAVVNWNLNDPSTKICTAFKCHETIDEMSSFIKMLTVDRSYKICYLERVHAFPTDGRSSAFKFGMNYGIWQGILSSFKIKTELIVPRKWQSFYGELPKNKQERKRKLKEIAIEKSNIKATLKTADAILIALYGYTQQIELSQWIPEK